MKSIIANDRAATATVPPVDELPRQQISRRMRIVVGIATVGRSAVLSEMLKDLAQQCRLPDRVIIGLVHPEDADQGVLAQLPFEVQTVFSPIGLPRQRNAILHAAAGFDIAVFFDDDFLPERVYIANAEALLVRHPDIVLATGNLIEDGIHGPGLDPDYARKKLAGVPPQPADGAVTPDYGAYGCNMVIRMAPVRERGLAFDEALPLYAWQEDIDFSRQLAPFGRIVRAHALTGIHLGVKGARTSGVRFGYSQIANPIYLMRKGTMSLQFGTRMVARNVVSNLVRALRPEPHVDRPGRFKGNILAFIDLMSGRLHPGRILELD